MPEWLYLGEDQDDSLMKQAKEKGISVTWLDKIPDPKDLESKGFVVDSFAESDLKENALRAIVECKEWKGPVASRLETESATSWAIRSGLRERFVGFQRTPGSVELLKGEITGEEAIGYAQKSFSEIDLLVIICRDQTGGILPRVLASMINEAAYMAQSGIASVDKIDRIMSLGANFPMGPFEWADKIGLDRILTLLESLSKEFGPQYQPCPWIRRKVEAGKLGFKTGEGFYNYSEGDAP